MKKISDIPGISQDDMRKLQTVFDAQAAVMEVILYGSRAKGTHRSGSDIDLTLRGVGLTTGWLMDLSSQIDDLLLPYSVDLSILSHIENTDLLEHIERVGKVVFSNEQ